MDLSAQLDVPEIHAVVVLLRRFAREANRRRRLIIVAPFACTRIPAVEHSFGAPHHDVVTTLNVNNITANVDDCDGLFCFHSRDGIRRRLLLRLCRALMAVAQAPRAVSDPCALCGAVSRQIAAAGPAAQRVRPHAARVLSVERLAGTRRSGGAADELGFGGQHAIDRLVSVHCGSRTGRVPALD